MTNPILLLALILTACCGIFIWCEPSAAVWLSHQLYARAIALQEARDTYRLTYRRVLAERRQLCG